MKKMKVLQHRQFETIRFYSHNTYYITDKRKLYEVLGLEPNATQAEIKSAYYKLSMVYHPDKSKDSEEAKIKFQEISDAYEVLGNYELRKKYDKGILHPKRTVSTETETADKHSDMFTRKVKTRKPPLTGKTQIYNFDEFYKMHYGETIRREVRSRKQYKEFVEEKKQHQRLTAFEAIVFVVLFGGIVTFVESSLSRTDKPTRTIDEK